MFGYREQVFATEKFSEYSDTNFFQRFPVFSSTGRNSQNYIPFLGNIFYKWANVCSELEASSRSGRTYVYFAGTGVQMEEAAINRRTYVLFWVIIPAMENFSIWKKLEVQEGASITGESWKSGSHFHIWKPLPARLLCGGRFSSSFQRCQFL